VDDDPRATVDLFLQLAGGNLRAFTDELSRAAQGGAPDPAPQALLDGLRAAKESGDALRAKLKSLGDRALGRRIEKLKSAKSQLRTQYFQQDLDGFALADVSARFDAIGGRLQRAWVDARAFRLEPARGDLKDAAKSCGAFVTSLQAAAARG